jgi:hypothetical protein
VEPENFETENVETEKCWCPCRCGCRADQGELESDGLCLSCKQGNHEVPPEEGVTWGVPELLALHRSIVKQYEIVLAERAGEKLPRASKHALTEANRKLARPFEKREEYACLVCGNVPDEEGTLEHGRGCYELDENGGGTSYVDFSED